MKKTIRKKNILIKGMVLCLFLSITVGITTGCNTKENTKRKPEPEETKLESKEDKDSNLGIWGRAMGSVLISMNEGNVYYFGGYEPTEQNQKAAASILEQSWQIHNRKELLIQIRELIDTGARMEYRKESKEMRAMTKKQLKTAMKQLSGDTKIHYSMIQYNWNQWKKKGLLAWDMCRVSHLAQWGYIAGYLEIKEAQAVIQPAAEKLKNNFTSWEEVQKNWLDGYALYACIDAQNPAGTDYEVRENAYQELVAAQEKNGVLYEEELFQKDIIPLADVTAETIFAELTEEKLTTSETESPKASPKTSTQPKQTKK